MPQWVAAVSHEHLSNILGISESMLSIVKEKTRFFAKMWRKVPWLETSWRRVREGSQGGSGCWLRAVLDPRLVPRGHTSGTHR